MAIPDNTEDQSSVWHPGTSFRGWRFNAPPPDGALSIFDLIETSRDDHYAPHDIFDAPCKGWSAHVCDGLFTHARCHDVLMFEGANLIGMTGAELMRHIPEGWSDPVIEVDGLVRLDCDPLGLVAWLGSGNPDTGRAERCSVAAVWPPTWDPGRSFGGIRFHQPLPKLPGVAWYEIRPFFPDDDPQYDALGHGPSVCVDRKTGRVNHIISNTSVKLNGTELVQQPLAAVMQLVGDGWWDPSSQAIDNFQACVSLSFEEDDPERRVISVSMWGQDHEKLSTDEALARIFRNTKTRGAERN